MSRLLLDSLEIQRFRAFNYLQIEKLGRINLIVGKNNVGKTCLLEALQVYASRARPSTLWQILVNHDEYKENATSITIHPTSGYTEIDGPMDYSNEIEAERRLEAIKYLFFGRKEITAEGTEPFEIGPIQTPQQKLSVSIRTTHPIKKTQEMDSDNENTKNTIISGNTIKASFVFRFGNQDAFESPLNSRFISKNRANLDEIEHIFTTANGQTPQAIGTLWDRIALTDQEDIIIKALRIMAPGMEAISMIGNPPIRTVVSRINGISERLPLLSLGEGMQRMLGLALALVNTQNSLLLIDEIENGIHYSVQTAMWRLIFEIAHKLNVQVFATSHSWDCILAFKQAAQENAKNTGMLIRLEYKKDGIRAVLFDEEKLAIATRDQIEVR